MVDEIGHLPMSLAGGMLFFRPINQRYERASPVLASNKSFEDWGRILGEEVMAAAPLDRLLHRRRVITIRGQNYRLREKRRSGLFRGFASMLSSSTTRETSNPPEATP